MNENRSSGAWRVVALACLSVVIALTVADRAGPIEGDARIYVEAARSIGDGKYEAPTEPSGVPRYPPGYPAVLAPFVAVAGEGGARAASTGMGVLLVVLVWAAARRLGGHRAAALAAVLWALSPLVSDYSTDVMSDPTAAVLVMTALLAAMSGRWVLVGFALALSSWVRLIHVVFLGAIGRRGTAWLAAVLVLVPLGVFQLRTYGRLAGYDGGDAQFSLSHIAGQTPLVYFDRPSPWPNWQFFPGLLWGLSGGMVPMLPLFAGFELVVRRADPSARLAAWLVVANVVVYLPYFYQVPRFMLPSACLVVVFAAAGAIRVVDDVGASRRTVADTSDSGSQSPVLADT